MKRTVCFILTLLVACLGLRAEEELVKVEASIIPKRLARGQEGKVVLKLEVKKGITISPQPAFTIELAASEILVFPKNFFTASDLEIEIFKNNRDEHLNLSLPIEIPFTVSMEAKAGRHVLEGRVKYFANSKQERWCLKKSSKFSVPFFARNRTVQK